jgi:short-subunit dehydrogenase
MQLKDARILLTGASGGLGRALARELAAAGAALLMTGRDPRRPSELPSGPAHRYLQADLGSAAGIAAIVQAAREFGINVLINNAGTSHFGLLDAQDWNIVAGMLETNLAAPIRLTQALLPWLKEQPAALILNVGSTFGSLPFAGFAAYSASKGGLRAFSQALRRELADTPVRVCHVAPRAIATALNSPAVNALNQELGSACDPPEAVARQIAAMLRDGIAERHLGFPERLFAWLNGLAPTLIDRGLRAKLTTIKAYATHP